MSHPRDRFITIYGRKPVLEALDQRLPIAKVVLAHNAQGPVIKQILGAAKRAGITVERARPEYVNRLSRNKRHDQGVVADVQAARMSALESWDPQPGAVFVLDGVTNPANVGLIIRAVTAAGAAGVVLPRKGCPPIGPLVIKASAGVVFRAPILRTESALQGVKWLAEQGYRVIGLGGGGTDLDAFTPSGRAAYVLGNETEGVSQSVGAHVDEWLTIPMAAGVESLNVATAAAVVAYAVRVRT